MSANHNHADEGGSHAGHDHTAGANAKSLTIALGLTGSFLIAELVGAYWFNSLALLSDAAHMFTDAAALAIALAAIKIGQRAADKQRTYGYRRFEILAAAFNAVLLFVVAGYVLYEGVLRFFKPEAVGSVGMLIVASIGLLVNLIAMRVLVSGKDASPLFKQLSAASSTPVRWNFYKYVISRDGLAVTAFNSMADPGSPKFVAEIEKQLAKP